MANQPIPSPSSPELLPNEREVSFETIYAFLVRNRAIITFAVLTLIIVAAGALFLHMQETQRRHDAKMQLARARTPQDYENVAREYAGTTAAATAWLRAGEIRTQQQDWDKARTAYSALIGQHPESMLTPSAAAGMALILESQGKLAEAIAAYQKVAKDYPKSFQAAQALYNAARLMQANGQTREARQAFEELVTAHAGSAWVRDAGERLSQLKLQEKAAAARISAPTENPAPSAPPPSTATPPAKTRKKTR
ncbi:MAG: tetratricopeptide repeat protein [Verrucomicrobiae bacterium]|nr:tetratricopeptide repeat protein [Verrucomicrobiae bacterium]